MTRKEWIEQDCSFYHITQTSNLESIFENGLENRNGLGICVVRTKEDLIVKYICEMMLNTNDELSFSIIEIKPSQIQLQTNEIWKDNTDELTNSLHNYIKRDYICISRRNVVGEFKSDTMGISNLSEIQNEIREKFSLEELQ